MAKTVGLLTLLTIDSHQKISEYLDLLKYIAYMPFADISRLSTLITNKMDLLIKTKFDVWMSEKMKTFKVELSQQHKLKSSKPIIRLCNSKMTNDSLGINISLPSFIDNKLRHVKIEDFIEEMTMLNTINIYAITTFNNTAFYCRGYEIQPSVFIGDTISQPNLGYCNIVLLNARSELVKLNNFTIVAENLDQFFTNGTRQGETTGNRLGKLQHSVYKRFLNEEENDALVELVNKFNNVFMDVPEIIINPFVNSIDETEEEIMTNFLSTSFIMLISKNPNINTRWTTALDFRKLKIFVQNHTIKLTPPEQVFNILGKAMYASIFQITQGPNDYTQFYKNFSVHQDTSNDKNRQIIMAGLFSPLCLIFFRRIICINKDFNSHLVLHKIQDFQESCLGLVLLSRQDQDKKGQD